MSSVIYNGDDKATLYTDLHRLTLQRVPGATLEMVKDVLFRLASGSGYDRSSVALKLYWTLSSDYFTMSPTSQYLERMREMVSSVQGTEEIVGSPLRAYWIEKREQ